MRIASLLPVLLFTTGCTIETVTTEIDVRDPNRAALLRTDVRGTERIPLPANGQITLAAPAAPSITFGLPTTIARWCTMASREPRGESPKYEVVDNHKCVDSPIPGSIGYSLEGDWRDVRIVEHHRPDRAGAWAIIGLSTLLYGALTATVFLVPGMQGGMAARYGLGLLTAGIGAGYDLAMVPTVTASDTDILLHEFGPVHD
jgi:hypothetical protein